MADERQTGSAAEKEIEETLFEKVEKARVARAQSSKVRAGRRLIVPFRDTIPSKRVHR